jgi:transposase
MQVVTTVGLDIAKSVFQVHGVDAAGQVVVRRQLKRRYVLAFFEKLPPCLVGLEACASSHHWSRALEAFGHTVKLMPPAYVKPYVKRQKNDTADAEAICEAVTRANMRFVATKTPEQQKWSDPPSHAPSVHSPADRGDQCDPGSSCRVRDRRAGRTQQRSSGGRTQLFGISKRGDRYLRTLMIHGARAALGKADGKQDPRSRWLGNLRQRRHPNVAAVALANKNARIVWAMLARDKLYEPELSVQAA